MRVRGRWALTLSAIAFVSTAQAHAASLTLAWDAATDGITVGYYISMGTTSGTYTVQRDAAGATTYRFDGLADGTKYCFAVRAYNAARATSAYSNEVCHTTPAAPPTNTGGTGTGTSGGTTSGNTTPTTTTPPPAPTAPPPAPSAPSGGSSGGGSGSPAPSSGSSTGTSTTSATAGAFPLTAIVRSDRFVDLTWSPVAGASAYRVEAGRSSGETAFSTPAAVASSTFDFGAVGGGTYFMRVRPVVGGALGASSAEVVVTVGAGSSAPQSLAATMVGSVAHLSWQPPSDGLGAASYVVEVGSASGAADVSRATVGGLSLVLENLTDGSYFVRVRAMRAGTSTEPSREAVIVISGAAAQCAGPPASPTAFVATAQGSLVHLSWKPGAGEPPTGYLLFVGSAPGREDLMTVPLGPGTSLGATAGDGVYALRLVATNACGASFTGAEALLTVGRGATGATGATAAGDTTLPGAPESLTQEVSGNVVTLTWRPPATGGAATRYIIEAMTAAGPVAVDTGNASTVFTHANTPPGEYVIRIRAANAAGVGPQSQPVTVVVP